MQYFDVSVVCAIRELDHIHMVCMDHVPPFPCVPNQCRSPFNYLIQDELSFAVNTACIPYLLPPHSQFFLERKYCKRLSIQNLAKTVANSIQSLRVSLKVLNQVHIDILKSLYEGNQFR